jgi:hypothetical protein
MRRLFPPPAAEVRIAPKAQYDFLFPHSVHTRCQRRLSYSAFDMPWGRSGCCESLRLKNPNMTCHCPLLCSRTPWKHKLDTHDGQRPTEPRKGCIRGKPRRPRAGCRNSPSSRWCVFLLRRVSRNAVAARSDRQSASSNSRITRRPPSELSCVPRNSSRTRRSKSTRSVCCKPAPSG